MGSCFSCFRGENDSTEREPLLPKAAPPRSTPSRFPLKKTVDILAALQSGKLPSQDQLNVILQQILSSSTLQCDDQHVSQSGIGPLSDSGRRASNDIRELLESVLQLGMEKNLDDRFQDFLYLCSQMEGPPIRVSADSAIEASEEGLAQLQAQVPTHNEFMHDTAELVKSLKLISRLILTSAVFRLLLSDMLSSAREFLAQVAAGVGNVALQAQVAAEGVEKAAKMEGGSLNILRGNVEEAVTGVLQGVDEAKSQSTSRETTKDVFVARVQDFIVRAHGDPKTLKALRKLLHITRKYARKLSRSANIISEAQTSSTTGTAESPAISVVPKSETSRALEDLKILLERLASGHSINPLLHSLADTVNSIPEQLPSSSSEADLRGGDLDLQKYLYSVNGWLYKALSPAQRSQPFYATSRAGTHTLENLYDGGHILFSSSSGLSPTSAWTEHLRNFLDAYDEYTTALAHDRTTMRVVGALSQTHADFADFAALALGLGTHAKRGGRAWREEALRDLTGWVIPCVVGAVGRVGIPMPRVEYKSRKVEGALDALHMAPGEVGGVMLDVVPDSLVVRTYNEVKIDMEPLSRLEGGSKTSTSSRMQVQIEGVRVAIRELGYFFRYGGDVVGYSDQGLLSVDVGSSEGRHKHSPQGLSLDIDIALDTVPSPPTPGKELNAESGPEPLRNAFFDILDVRASVCGLQFKIDRSRHWVLNKLLLQPLAGPVVERVVSSVLEAQIRALLEKLAAGLATVREEAQRIQSETRRDDGAADECDMARQEQEEPAVGDYLEALLKKGPEAFGLAPKSEQPEEGEGEVETHTNTTVTLKGVVHTTKTNSPNSDGGSSGSSQEHTETETSVAIGGGSMLFPDKAGPSEGEEEGNGSNYPVLDLAVQAAEDTLRNVGAFVENTAGGAAELRGNIKRSETRREERQEAEGSKDGWRSRAFDIR